MSKSISITPQSDTASRSCFQSVKESRYTDVILIIASVALLLIGILASTGMFNFMGVASATYLSYGMYAGAALFFIAEIIKIAMNCCKKTEDLNQDNSDPIRNPMRKVNKKIDPPIQNNNSVQTDENNFHQRSRGNQRAAVEKGREEDRDVDALVSQFEIGARCELEQKDLLGCQHLCWISFTLQQGGSQQVQVLLSRREIGTIIKDITDKRKIVPRSSDYPLGDTLTKTEQIPKHFQGVAYQYHTPVELLKQIKKNYSVPD